MKTGWNGSKVIGGAIVPELQDNIHDNERQPAYLLLVTKKVWLPITVQASLCMCNVASRVSTYCFW